jgi:two-component system, NtrC family, response regulator AtoC
MGRTPVDLEGATEAANTGSMDASRLLLDGASRCLLVVVSADGATRTLELTPGVEITIGRDESATVRVDETRVSRMHARIFRRDGAVIVEDMGSRNGTRINDAKLVNARQELVGGNRIRVGTTEILVAMIRALPPTQERASDGAAASRSVVVADPEMQRVMSVAQRLGASPTTCLILGETGVGKDILARTIHAASARARKPFVRFNCASTPEGLLESELFGHERGAFTGADRKKLGYVEAAAEGTLFLDEVGELSTSLQAKLLHFLEHRTINRVGSTEEIAVDVRVLAATHRRLKEEVSAGRFREDLYYRLAAFTLDIPPLRERVSEILLLAEHFARELAVRFGRRAPNLDPRAGQMLLTHDWPGNVRELRNAVEHAFVLADDTILPEHLPETLRGVAASSRSTGALVGQLDAVERSNIVAALEAENGNRTRAAERLGISRRALIYKLHKHGIS